MGAPAARQQTRGGHPVTGRVARLLRQSGAGLVVALALGACATRAGHYYQDDGPPEHVPAGLAATPDAVPRPEPLNPHANRPYVALGRTYTPDTREAPFEQRGIATWYGRQYHGNRTASGEPYDMFAMTAAHPTLPIPSYARVTNVRTGASVVVRINDRGPFLRDRIIDLSFAAATRLGLAGAGSGEVTVERITSRDIANGNIAAAGTTSPAAQPALAPLPLAAASVSTAPLALASLPSPMPPAPTFTSGTRTNSAAPVWAVQLGAFAVSANAEALRERLALLLSSPEAAGLPAAARMPRVEFDGRINRVLIGNLGDRATAQAWSERLERFLLRDTALYFH